jgi:hypothetical protein
VVSPPVGCNLGGAMTLQYLICSLQGISSPSVSISDIYWGLEDYSPDLPILLKPRS